MANMPHNESDHQSILFRLQIVCHKSTSEYTKRSNLSFIKINAVEVKGRGRLGVELPLLRSGGLSPPSTLENR